MFTHGRRSLSLASMDLATAPDQASYDDDALHRLAEQVGNSLRVNRHMVCTAESCTAMF